MNFKWQVVTAAQKTAFVCEGLEEVAAHSYESDNCSNCIHAQMLAVRYCSHISQIKIIGFWKLMASCQMRAGLQNILFQHKISPNCDINSPSVIMYLQVSRMQPNLQAAQTNERILSSTDMNTDKAYWKLGGTHTNTKILWTAKSQCELNQHCVRWVVQLLHHTSTPGGPIFRPVENSNDSCALAGHVVLVADVLALITHTSTKHKNHLERHMWTTTSSS